MGNLITGIISITISAVILSSVFINTIKDTNQTYTIDANTTGTWTAAEISMWSLLTLIGVVGLLYGVLNVFGLA